MDNKEKINEEEINMEIKTEKKERKISTSYTAKRLGETIKALKKAKLITTKEEEQLKTINTQILHRWIGIETGM